MKRSVQINSRIGVLTELMPLLTDVQQALEAFAEGPDQADELQESTAALGQVRGTLNLLELHGGARLAEEMQAMAIALVAGADIDSQGLEALMKASLRLPDYVKRIAAGSQDVPLVLLPLINEMRAARALADVTAGELFFPELPAPFEQDDDGLDPAASGLQDAVRRARPTFQRSLLNWFRDADAPADLTVIDELFETWSSATHSAPVKEFWLVCRAVVEGVSAGGIADLRSVKVLLARLEQLLRTVISEGEAPLAGKLGSELIRGFLYQIARDKSDGSRVKDIKSRYRLAEQLPGEDELESAMELLSGPDLELSELVNNAVKEDISQVKDAIEIYVHGANKDPQLLGTAVESGTQWKC